ncbi:universal stress protein, partial [Streptomyces sp. NPDC048483]|uniref:universal stress protein n=1 Tax=Streptomyces sp. NPDC048483 TaxID=3154927 RepID=UPI003446C29A
MNDTVTTGRPVLVGVGEGSDQQAVVQQAALHARLHGSPLHLLHVTERPDQAGLLPHGGDRAGAPSA